MVVSVFADFTLLRLLHYNFEATGRFTLLKLVRCSLFLEGEEGGRRRGKNKRNVFFVKKQTGLLPRRIYRGLPA